MVELYEQQCRYAMGRAVAEVNHDYERKMQYENSELEVPRQRVRDLQALSKIKDEQFMEKDASSLAFRVSEKT